jgi:serine protease Do
MKSRNSTRLAWTLVVGLSVALATVTGLQLSNASSFNHEILRPAPTPTAVPADTPGAKAVLQQFSNAFEEASQKVNRSVVPILSEHKVPAGRFLLSPQANQSDPFGEDLFRRFFAWPRGEQKEQTLRSLGSGVIVSEDGYILTNSHVVQDADKLTVITEDDKKHAAHIVGTDPETDVAVIKIDAEHLPAATLGDSDDLQVGQWVIAVGNPLEMLHTVTAGIISATGRSSVGLADYENFIQTDASINPGNSGGALADLDGRVVGINTAIASPSGGNVGIGFAIPINMAHRVMTDLIADGKISRGYLGVLLQDIDEDLANGLGLKTTEGVLIGDVNQGEPADEAGVKRGDVIVAYNGERIEDGAQLRDLVADSKPGTRADLTILRDGREESISVELGDRPGSVSSWTPGQRGNDSETPHLGLSVRDLTPDVARHLGYENERGALIADVEPGSPADEAGLKRGDLIQRVGTTDVGSVDDLQQALADATSGSTVAILVQREENSFFVTIQVP